MKTLLKLNHWQVFLLIYGIPLLILFVPFKTLASPSFKIVLAVVYIYFMLMVFSWPFLIGMELVKRLPPSVSVSKKNFLFHFICICIFIFAISITNWLHPEWIIQYTILYVVLICYYFIAAFIVVRFASKVFTSVELSREAKASDYAGYIFAIWFSFMGVWIVQPKIRKIINQTPKETG
jgi:hypothetical protein